MPEPEAGQRLRAALITREFPPEVYGGAGVHIENLARELSRQDIDVAVHCFGQPRQSPLVAAAYEPWPVLSGKAPHMAALQTMSVDLAIAAAVGDANLVHSHTWYANFAGHLAKLTYGMPHVVTCHSLEPLRPWKAEQLGGGYALSSFCERTGIEAADAVIAVSEGMRDDILRVYPAVAPERVHVINNGVDFHLYRPVTETDVLAAHGLSPDEPYVIFVGRITRQKGIVHLLEAARHVDPVAKLVLCAGAPDTPEIAAEFTRRVEELQRTRGGIVWIQDMLPAPQVVQLLSNARLFVCPSVYEPFGLVNVEAMACGAPVVATAVGGIPEIVVDGVTGLLVRYDARDLTGEPIDPAGLATQLAHAINQLLDEPSRARRMGDAGLHRARAHFSWTSVAERTAALYRSL